MDRESSNQFNDRFFGRIQLDVNKISKYNKRRKIMEINQTVAQMKIIERQLNDLITTIENLSLDVVISDYDIEQMKNIQGRIERKIKKLELKQNERQA